jgi:hypothetical protein
VSVRVWSGFSRTPEPPSWPWTRWAVPLFAVAGLVLVPWIVLLVVLLPSDHLAAHWDIAWAGFDLALAVLLVTVALAAWKRPSWLEGAATATATLLFVDAWFDVLTSSTQAELVASGVEAVLIELPLAVLCVLLARDAERGFLRQMVEHGEPQPARLRVVRGGQAAGQPADRDDDRLSA